MYQTLIGVDIGTTNIKAVAFTPQGTQITKTSSPTPTHHPRPDWAHYDPNELWGVIARALRHLMDALPSQAEPAAVAFTSMGEAGVPVDAKGEPTFEIIAWFDKRTLGEFDHWHHTIGPARTAAITGLPLRSIFSAYKMLWLKNHQPESYARTHCWLNMADYGAYKLCGAQATDYSLASRTSLLHLETRTWSDELLSLAELRPQILAELVPSGTVLGHVHQQAAAESGLPEGLPVCSGGHDHVCGAFALGITQAGDVFDSMGTAESNFLSLDSPRLDTGITQNGIGQGVHVYPGKSYAMSGLNFSGGCVDWARQLLLSEAPPEGQSFELLSELAMRAPAGCDGVFFLPHLRQGNPPNLDPRARGAFVGLTADIGAAHIARATLEGIAYEYQHSLNNMLNTFSVTPKRVIATGGGTRNTLLMRIKTDLLDRPIYLPKVEEATCLGAAMLAGVGAGVYSSFDEANTQVAPPFEVLVSDKAAHQFYKERFMSIYLQLYHSLKTVHHHIHEQATKR